MVIPKSKTLHFVFLEDVIMFILAPVRIKIKDINLEISMIYVRGIVECCTSYY